MFFRVGISIHNIQRKVPSQSITYGFLPYVALMIKSLATLVIAALAILFHEPVIKSLREQVSSAIVDVDLVICTTSKPREKQLAVSDISTHEKQPNSPCTKINERGESSLHMHASSSEQSGGDGDVGGESSLHMPLEEDASSSERSEGDGDVGHMASAVAQLSGHGGSQREEGETDQGTEDPLFCAAISKYFQSQPALEILHYEQLQISQSRLNSYEAKKPEAPGPLTSGTYVFSGQCEACGRWDRLSSARGTTCHKLKTIAIRSEPDAIIFEDITVDLNDRDEEQTVRFPLPTPEGFQIPAGMTEAFPAPQTDGSRNTFMGVLSLKHPYLGGDADPPSVSHFGIVRKYLHTILPGRGREKFHWDSLAPTGKSLPQLKDLSLEPVSCLGANGNIRERTTAGQESCTPQDSSYDAW